MNSAINQVLKACQITIQSAALLEKEVSDLRAANKKKKQNEKLSNRQFPYEGGLTVSEALQVLEQIEYENQGPPPPPQNRNQPPTQQRTRALPRCGLYGIEGHKRNACQNRPT